MGEEKHDGLAIPGHIVLAHEQAFKVGQLNVDPSTREIEREGIRETLESRVMQVLVALARANGRTVTRDELIAWCWGGRIVGEDAINRAIFRLRQVASELGAGTFGIETITKVGYRLVQQTGSSTSRSSAPFLAKPDMSRRELMGTAAAAAAVGVGAWAWRKPWRHRPVPEAVNLVRLGDLAQRAARPDQTRQAVAYFERAVRMDPNYAAAWGMLALSYTHSLDGFSEAQLAGLPGRIRSAAARALDLDPDNVDAQLALACIPPYFRNWSRMEKELRGIRDRNPDHWLANGRLAILYYQVGRMIEGAEIHQGVIAKDPMIPGPYAFAASALSNAGRIQEADALLKEATDRWPANPFVWSAKYNHLLSSGRPASAVALLLDPEARPSGVSDGDVEPYVTLARAVDRRRPADVGAAVRFQLQMAEKDTRAIAEAAPIFAMLGRLDLSFLSVERYFLNRGTFGQPSPIGRYTRRYTDFLFTPAMFGAQSDPRFGELTRAIGLDAYWRGAGMQRPVRD